jgi:hypothetical protein
MAGNVFQRSHVGQCLFEIAGVPQDDRGDQQVEAGGTVGLVTGSPLSKRARRCIGLRIERAFSASFPQRQHIARIVAATTPGEIKQRAVKGGAIIVCQLDQASFLDQSAQLNQVACSFATLHDPAPAIRSPFRRFRSQRRRPVQS